MRVYHGGRSQLEVQSVANNVQATRAGNKHRHNNPAANKGRSLTTR